MKKYHPCKLFSNSRQTYKNFILSVYMSPNPTPDSGDLLTLSASSSHSQLSKKTKIQSNVSKWIRIKKIEILVLEN